VEEAVYRLPAKTIIIFSSVIGFGTLIGCYLIAVYLGHVQAWLPMISDCAVYSPEKYPFRIGIITTAGHLALSAVCLYFYLHTVTLGGTRVTDKVALVFCLLSTFFLAAVGAINERENGSWHGISAVAFFALYLISMIMTTFRLKSSSSPSRQISKNSIVVKTAIATLCTIALIGYVIVNAFRMKTESAICEWVGTLCILAYNMSFMYEFNDELWIAAVLKEQPGRPATVTSKMEINHSGLNINPVSRFNLINHQPVFYSVTPQFAQYVNPYTPHNV